MQVSDTLALSSARRSISDKQLHSELERELHPRQLDWQVFCTIVNALPSRFRLTDVKALNWLAVDTEKRNKSAWIRCMTADQDIWLSAQHMIDRYGDDALIEIKKRIRELEQSNQTEARDVWLRIRSAAETLIDSRNNKPRQ